jgi:hypothetical protein
MVDTHFVIPADKVARYAPRRCRSIRYRQAAVACADRPAFECGGGCTASTAMTIQLRADARQQGTYAINRVLGRKTVEYMTANHLRPAWSI